METLTKVEAPKVETKNICPQCGADWDNLAGSCISENHEDRCSAWSITESCPACKAAMLERARGRGETILIGYAQTGGATESWLIEGQTAQGYKVRRFAIMQRLDSSKYVAHTGSPRLMTTLANIHREII